MKYTITLNGKTYEVEVEEGQAMLCLLYPSNVDTLVQNELLINWPIRVLCKEDCKGICSRWDVYKRQSYICSMMDAYLEELQRL